MLAVEQHFPARFLRRLHRLRDAVEVLFLARLQRDAHVIVPCLGDEADRVGRGVEQRAQTGIVGDADARPLGHAERGKRRARSSAARRRMPCPSGSRRDSRPRRSRRRARRASSRRRSCPPARSRRRWSARRRSAWCRRGRGVLYSWHSTLSAARRPCRGRGAGSCHDLVALYGLVSWCPRPGSAASVANLSTSASLAAGIDLHGRRQRCADRRTRRRRSRSCPRRRCRRAACRSARRSRARIRFGDSENRRLAARQLELPRPSPAARSTNRTPSGTCGNGRSRSRAVRVARKAHRAALAAAGQPNLSHGSLLRAASRRCRGRDAGS